MSKKNKKTQHRCQDHVFQLKSLYNQSKLPDRTCISFCENAKNKKQAKTCKNHSSQCVSYPIYNSDHNHATPSFILQEDKSHFKQQGQRLRQQHDMKMQSYQDQKDSLNVPKPKSKTNHCNVCRQPYQDYLIHIQSQSHHEKIRNNIYTKYIDELAHRFEVWNLKNKNKIYNSSHHTLTTQGEDQKEIPDSLPKKKIKTQGNAHQQLNLQNVPQQNLQNYAVPFQNNYIAPTITNPTQAIQNTINPNIWYNSYYYPSLSYPYVYQNMNSNQTLPLPIYYWVNNPYFCQQNFHNLQNFNLNQGLSNGNQQFVIPQNILQLPQINQNFLSRQ